MNKKKGNRRGLALLTAIFVLLGTFLPTFPVSASNGGFTFQMGGLTGYSFAGAEVRITDSTNLPQREYISSPDQPVFQNLTINESQTYTIEVFADFYKESNTSTSVDETVIYYGKKVLNGEALQGGLTWELEDNLIEITPDFTGFELSSEGITLSSPENEGYYLSRDISIHKPAKLLISPTNTLNVYATGNDKDNKYYYLSFQTPKEKGTWNLEAEKDKAEQVTFNSKDEVSKLTQLNMISRNVTNYNLHLDGEEANLKEVYVTPGNYDIEISTSKSDGTIDNSIGWKLDNVAISGPQNLEYRAYPDVMEITDVQIMERGVDVNTTLSGGDFQYEWSQSSDVVGKLEILEGEETIYSNENFNDLRYFHAPDVQLEGSKYTITTKIVDSADDTVVHATASKEVDVPGRKDDQINGMVVTAEDLAGEALTGARVRLFEKVVYENHPDDYTDKYNDDSTAIPTATPYGLNMIYETSIIEKDGGAEAFIPNAYLLKGKEYELIIESATSATTTTSNEKIIYHRSLMGGEETSIDFSNDNLSKINFDTEETYTQQVLMLDIVNLSNKTQNSWPINLGDGTEYYVQTDENALLIGQFYKEENKETTVLSKMIKPVSGEEFSVTLEDLEFSTITAPSGYKDSKISLHLPWIWLTPSTSVKINSDFYSPYGDYGLSTSIFIEDINGNGYSFSKWLQEVPKETQLTIPTSFEGKVYRYGFNPGKEDWLSTDYSNEAEHIYLNGFSKSIPTVAVTNDITFESVQQDGTIQQLSVTEENGVTNYEEQNPETDTTETLPGTVDSTLRYQLYKDNQAVGDPIHAYDINGFSFIAPNEAGEYQLKLENYPSSSVIQLSLDQPIKIEQTQQGEVTNIKFEMVSGDSTRTLQNINSRSIYRLEEDNGHSYAEEFPLWWNNADFKMVDIWIPQIQDEDKFLIVTNGNFSSGTTGQISQFVNTIELTGTELKQLEKLEVLKDIVKVDVKSSFSQKMSSYDMYVQKQLWDTNSYFTGHINFYYNDKTSLYLNADDYSFHYQGVSGEKAYYLTKELTVNGATAVSFTDKDPVSAISIKQADGTVQSFVSATVNNMGKDQTSLHSVGYDYPHHKGLLNTLYLTPGEYDLSFDIMKTETNETPWSYEFGASVNANQNAELAFNGFEMTPEITNLETNPQSEKYTNAKANVLIKSGDLQLEQVAVYREQPQVIRWGLTSDYDGDFYFDKWVYPTVKIVSSTNEVVYETEGDHDRQYSFYIPLKATEGTFKFLFEQPIGPKKSIKAEDEFTIGKIAEFVNIQQPLNGSLWNSRTITVSGKATPSKTITIEATKGESAPIKTGATADEEGNYSATITVSEDGEYSILSFLGDNRDIHSQSISIEVDTTKPSTPANLRGEHGSNAINLTWDKVNDASKYIVSTAKKGEAFTDVEVTDASYSFPNIKPGTTYQFKVTAVDKAGNRSETSQKVEVTTSDFVVTSLGATSTESEFQLYSIGSKLDIVMEGSYEDGYVGSVDISYIKDGENATRPIQLTYNTEKKKYEGQMEISEGISKIVDIKGRIVNGSETTDTVTTSINKAVGATLSGEITSGGKEVTKAAQVRLVGKYNIKRETDDKGQFSFAGIPNGDYSINGIFPVTNGKTFYNVLNGKVTLENGVIKQLDTAIDLPVYHDVQFKFVESDGETKETILEPLQVNISGANQYSVYGYIGENGLFTTWGNETTLRSLPSGDYNVRVYKSGVYKETTQTISLNSDKDVSKPIEIEVEKMVKEVVDVVLDFGGQIDLTNIDSISLFSWNAYQEYGYSEVGNYYISYKDLEDGKITIPNVAHAGDYQLYIYEEGYRQFSKSGIEINALKNKIDVSLDQGLTVKGSLKDSDGNIVTNGQVYAYSNTSYASTTIKQDGTFELVGLAKDEEIQLEVSSQEYISHRDSFTESENEKNLEITLHKATFVHGKVFDKNNNPLQYVYVNAYAADENSDKLGAYKGWARTGSDGYFKIYGLPEGEYDLEFSSYQYPNLIVRDVSTLEEGNFILQDVGEGSFAGEGNKLTASTQTVVPGKTIQYRLNYKNNGDGDASNVPLKVNLPANVSVIEESALLNGKEVAWNDGSIVVPVVNPGQSGSLTFEVTVNDGDETTVHTTATINDSEELLSASTNILFVTLNAPSTTAQKNVKVYGNAKPGSEVEVYANDKFLTKVKVDGRWWFADITLPVKEVSEEEEFELVVKAKDGTEVVTSQSVEVEYAPSIPQIEDVIVSAGWNGDVKLNPYTGLATFAIVEHTPMNTWVTFNDEVDSAAITFLGKTYEMKVDPTNKKKYTFDGNQLGAWSSYGEQLLEITFTKGDVTITLPLMEIIVLIDPSGFVFEGSLENPLQGVTATVEQKKDEEWKQWNAAFFGQVNPQVTDEDGRYGWDVIQGFWRVVFTKAGYESHISRVMEVPPPETQLNVPLVRTAPPQIETVTPANGSANIKKDTGITVTFDRLMNIEEASEHLKLFRVSGDTKTEVAGTVTPKEVKYGYKEEARLDNGVDFVEDTTKQLASTFVFKPTANLESESTYEIQVSGLFKDYAEKIVGDDSSYSFTTEAAVTPETPTPPVDNSSPGGGSSRPSTEEKPVVKGQSLEINDKLLEIKGEKATVNETDVIKAIDKADKVEELIIKAKDNVKEVTLSTKVMDALLSKNKNAAIQVEKDLGSYRLPLEEVNLKDLREQLGATSSSQLEISITIKPSKHSLESVSDMNVVSEAVEFSVGARYNGKTAALEQFNQYVQRVIPLSQSVDPTKTIGLKLTKDGFVTTPTIIDGNKAIINSMTNSSYVIVTSDQTFADVNNGASWAEEYIESLASKFIIKGKDNGLYGSRDNMTRAQFTVLLVRVLGLTSEEYDGRFKDISGDEWFNQNGELMAAVKHGIIKGKDNGTFAPYDSITRAQAAAMIARVLELDFVHVNKEIYDETKKVSDFKDYNQLGEWSKDSIEKVCQAGIMTGKDNGTFDPNGNTKRDQMAKILGELLNKLF